MICLNRSVLDFMESVITPESEVIEFGAGGSTEWFAKRCEAYSIETDPVWHKKVQDRLPFTSVLLTDNPSSLVAELEDADLILVDGKAALRNAFTHAAWPKVKKGGWLVFDDAQREQHKPAIAWLNTFADPVYLRWADGDIETAKDRLAMAWQK